MYVKPSIALHRNPMNWCPRSWMPSHANAHASNAAHPARAVRNDPVRRPGDRSYRLRWHLERDGRHQDRKLSADQQLSIGRDRWAGVRCRRPVRQRRTEWRGQGFAPGRPCQWAAERQFRFWQMEFGVGGNALQWPMDGDMAVICGAVGYN